MKEETIKYFYETASAKMLEFDKIIAVLEELAYTERAKEQVRTLSPSLSEA